MSIQATIRLKRSIFPFLNAIVYLFLFWLVTGFISRDPVKIIWWSAAGFGTGLLVGFIIQYFIVRFTLSQRPFLHRASLRRTTFFATLIAEFIVGLLLIGPFIWVLIRFIPASNIHSICCETPVDYGAAQFENVHLNTADGAIISGWYVAPTTQVGKAIILIHGYGYDRRGTDFQTRALIAAGYGVLLYDLRDHGESTGKLNTFNRMDVYQSDLLKVVNYLKQKPEINPAHIGVVGISLGAFATLNSSPKTLNEFSALWLDGLRFENFGAQLPVENIADY